AVLLAAAFGHNRRTVIITILLYLFSPVVLWYQVNGYVHETAVLPFYYGGWYCFFQLLLQRKQRWLWLTAVFLFTGIQFDWLPFFQATAMCGYLLFSRKEQLPRWMFLVPALAVVSGIGYIIYTYSSRTSLQDYFHFMSWKFSSRTVGRSGHSFLPFWPTSLNIVLFYILSYGLLLVWVVTALVRKRVHTFIVVMLITALLHHIVFWGFSSEHDYASLKSAFPLVFTAAVFLAGLSARTASYVVALTIACGIGQYFFLHNFSFRKGIQADDSFSYRAGEMVRRRPPGEIVFLNTSGVYYPQVEFYAGRPYRLAEDVQDALKQLNIQNNDTTSVPGATSKSVFIDVNNRRIFPLNRSPR
ncbi:MAG TPA: hypothetical protein VF145_00365, partial [Chitinophagaceae bacterium]